VVELKKMPQACRAQSQQRPAYFVFLFFKFMLTTSLSSSLGGALNQTADMYVFAYTFQPEFCRGKTNYYGCSNPKPFWKDHFTLHGLWPQYSSGGYPSFCTQEPFDKTIPNEVGWEDMTTYWPNAQYPETDPKYYDFWDHEWTKHGCISLTVIF
jgi:ribonuclease T2